MRLIIRLILLLIVLVAVYALWPRTPHPETFDGKTVGQLETRAWKGADATSSLDGVIALYQINDRQYGFPPFTAVTLSQNTARILHIFRSAPDAADQERALPLLADNLTAIKNATHADFDANLAAQQLFTVWSQSVESAAPAVLSKSIATFWATLYGKPATAFTTAANSYADALLANGFTPGKSADWNRVEHSLALAYEQLASALKK